MNNKSHRKSKKEYIEDIDSIIASQEQDLKNYYTEGATFRALIVKGIEKLTIEELHALLYVIDPWEC